MRRKVWEKEIANDCNFSVIAHGGAMCHEGKSPNYCDFHKCPRIELEKKED